MNKSLYQSIQRKEPPFVAQRTPTARIEKQPSRTSSGRFTELDKDKLRGGYYTSTKVAEWLCSWAIRTPEDRVLEPSCGDGIFLDATIQRFAKLGRSEQSIVNQLIGLEIIPEEADKARIRLEKSLGMNIHSKVETIDFFSWWQQSKFLKYDAVVGNPPFIRYQTFPEPHRTCAMEIMSNLGLTPNRLTNIWVPFVIAATASLKASGRLAMVLPAELLQVTYAAQLRSFLIDRFAQIDIITCNELFFDNAEQEVVLLLADNALEKPSKSNLCRVALTETKTISDITDHQPNKVIAHTKPKTICHDSEKWLKYFLTEHEITFMRELRTSQIATNLLTHAIVNVGVVTGKNEFFVLTNAQISKLGLKGYTIPLISRSAHLKGACIKKSEWEDLANNDEKVHLLYLNTLKDLKLPPSVVSYVQEGESKGVHKGYKCSIRAPWYEVPSVWQPDAFAFRQIYDFPRIVMNQVGATSTDTIHRLKCKNDSPERVIGNTYTWLTAASAEIEGRSYGGGVLELEPTEAGRLLMPTKLSDAIPLQECDKMIREGRLAEVLDENARLLLIKHMGLSREECFMLRDIWIKMRDRRLARKKRK